MWNYGQEIFIELMFGAVVCDSVIPQMRLREDTIHIVLYQPFT